MKIQSASVIALANLNGSAPDEIANQVAATIHGEKVTLPSERKEITLSPEVLRGCVGTYSVAPGVDLNVTLEGNHLVTQMTGQEKIPIVPQTQTLFFLKVIDAQLDFKRDQSGKVTQVTLHQGGHDTVARKK